MWSCCCLLGSKTIVVVPERGRVVAKNCCCVPSSVSHLLYVLSTWKSSEEITTCISGIVDTESTIETTDIHGHEVSILVILQQHVTGQIQENSISAGVSIAKIYFRIWWKKKEKNSFFGVLPVSNWIGHDIPVPLVIITASDLTPLFN